MKHTPGPWAATHIFGGEEVIAGGETGQAYVATALRAVDARLIAAAPDLLKELSHLVRLLEQPIDDGRVSVPGLATLNGAKAAIAKATGEA